MHIWTRLKPESEGVTGLGVYPDGMVEHDAMVGELLRTLDELGIADNTIVMYSTDNGAEKFTWPDGGTSPFRGEKNTNWEGGFRVPAVVRWPGLIEPGSIFNDIVAHEDWVPTLLAAAGEPDIKSKLLAGYQIGDRTYRNHLDGYDQTAYFGGKAPSPRKEFFYFSDDADVVAMRFNQWKIVFQEQRAHGMDVWQDPLTNLRLPKLFNVRTDPFEIADHEAMDYEHWRIERVFLLVPAQAIVARFLETFKEFPPRQEPGTFNLDQVLKELQPRAD
jgi:arylsulfatase